MVYMEQSHSWWSEYPKYPMLRISNAHYYTSGKTLFFQLFDKYKEYVCNDINWKRCAECSLQVAHVMPYFTLQDLDEQNHLKFHA